MRLMAVHAHPDDESTRGGATLAKYAAEGHDVLVVTATGGERGDILNPAMDRPGIGENLAAVRRAEMAAAAQILGVQQRWLGYRDSGLELDPDRLPADGFARVPLDEATERLVEVIREFRPQVLLTYNECGGYPHPDHVHTHQVAVAAYHQCDDIVAKLYYFHEIVRVTPAMVRFAGRVARAGLLVSALMPKRAAPQDAERTDLGSAEPPRSDPPLWAPVAAKATRRLAPLTRSARLTTEIHCADYYEQRDKALLAHATQVDPNGVLRLVPWTLRRELWPSEKFERVHSRVRVEPGLLETDLFAGIGDSR